MKSFSHLGNWLQQKQYHSFLSTSVKVLADGGSTAIHTFKDPVNGVVSFVVGTVSYKVTEALVEKVASGLDKASTWAFSYIWPMPDAIDEEVLAEEMSTAFQYK